MTTRTVLVLGCGLALGCGAQSPTAPAARPLDQHVQTAAFDYRYAASDSIDVEWQERYHQWATAALGVSNVRRITYNKYQSREHMGSLTGNYNTNGFADGERFEIHTLWPRDNHEVVHLYSAAWGRPVALWTEGLAVAFSVDPVAGIFEPRWHSAPVDDHARQFLRDGRLIAIGDLLTTGDFRRFDPNITYPEAGSFMRFLLNGCGLEGVQRLYRSGQSSDSAASVRQQFALACGQSIDEAEAAWRQTLNR